MRFMEGLFDSRGEFDRLPPMSRDAIYRGRIAGLSMLCLALAVGGCSRVPSEQREARDRNLRRAAAARQSQDIDQSIAWCERALDRRPRLALAHRELGLMLENYRQDYVAAIYHYRRYLQLRPETEARSEIEERIQHCRTAFAARIASFPAEFKRDLQTRDARIRRLEQEVAACRGNTALSQASVSAVSPAHQTRKDGEASASTRIHVVAAGENLATISTLYYGTPSKWKFLFNANQDRLTDANHIRVGTQLEIPNLNEE